MKNMHFKAYAVTNEIDLNKIAVECSIPKKFTWEEPLILQDSILSKILQERAFPDEKIMVFSFGSIVLINTSEEHTTRFLEYLKKFKPEMDLQNWNSYTDDYELRSGYGEMEFTDKDAVVPQHEFFYPELISTVLAKSVALEKTEEQIGKILDKVEVMIDRLEKGKLRVGNKELARTTAVTIRHEYNTINYIMILDKPDITWTNSHAAQFYDRIAEFFELNDRYEILKRKTDILNNIIGGFSSISHSIRGLFVEWVIVILIVVEVALMLADLFS